SAGIRGRSRRGAVRAPDGRPVGRLYQEHAKPAAHPMRAGRRPRVSRATAPLRVSFAQRGGPGITSGSLALGDHVPQDELQDAAVAVVIGFARGVDAYVRIEGHGGAIVLGGGDLDGAGDAPLVEPGEPLEGEGLRAV